MCLALENLVRLSSVGHFLVVVAVVGLGGGREARALTRCDVLEDAQSWVDDGVMYSQSICHDDPLRGGNCYRQDCSGFVSATWYLDPPGATTSTLDEFADTIGWDELEPGDAINDPGHHVMLVKEYDGGDSIIVYEEYSSGHPASIRTHSISTLQGDGYHPIRVFGIQPCSTPPPPPPPPPGQDGGSGGLDGGTPPPPPEPSPLNAQMVQQGSSAPEDTSGTAQFRACTAADVSIWFELRNTGSVPWTDVGDYAPASWGRAVALATYLNETSQNFPDPFVGVGRFSVNENVNDDVRPTGGECNNGPTCRRILFRLDGRAPTAPGFYWSSWRLVDESRGWFGPRVAVNFLVESCAGPTDPENPPGPSAGGADGGLPPGPGENGGGAGGEPGAAGREAEVVFGACQSAPGADAGFLPLASLAVTLLLGARRRRRR
jgi:hypothetical protein